MTLITTIHASLPYIDSEPTPAERSAAEALIATERLAVPDDPHHALLRPAYAPAFTPALQAELDRIASNPSAPPKLHAIDTSRYEEPELPPAAAAVSVSAPKSRSKKARAAAAEAAAAAAAEKQAVRAALERAGASASYLSSRRAHLALLDSHGRNAWLVGNWQLEAELAAVEAELAASRRAVDVVNIGRRRAQEEVGGEVTALEDGWRRGVGRVLEVEVGAEEMRRKILDVRKAQA